MSNFLSKILKNKKTLFFVFLFSILVIGIPQIAFGYAWYNPLSWGDSIGNALMNAVITATLFLPLLVTAVASDLVGLLLKMTLAIALGGTSYTNSPAVQIGWPIVRDLANMMIVLGFIVIGIATAIRFKDYEAKKLLAPLIIVAILVNFSLLICGLFIDGTNILTKFFFDPGGSGLIDTYAHNTQNSFLIIGNKFEGTWFAYGVQIIAMMIFNFISFFVLLLYMLLLFCRISALWILVILSPLAFVSYVFPATRNIWQQWWKNFFQWCIIGIPAGLFYYIGGKMITGMIETPDTALGTDSILTPAIVQVLSGSLSLLLPGGFLVIGFFVSLQFSAAAAGSIMNFANKHKGAVMAGGLGALSKAGQWAKNTKPMQNLAQSGLGQRVENLKNSTGTGVMGRVGAFTKRRTGDALGLLTGQTQTDVLANASGRADKTRSAFGRLGETMGAIKPGTTGVADIKKVEEEAKSIRFQYDRAKLSNDRVTIDRIRNDARTATGIKGAASYKVVSDAKDLTDTFRNATGTAPDFAKIHDRGRFAEVNGAQGVMETNEKLNPELRKYNKYETEEKAKTIMAAGVFSDGTAIPPGVGIEDLTCDPASAKFPIARGKIEAEVVADGFKKASVAEVKGYHKSVLSNSAFIENVRPEILKRAALVELNAEQATAIKGHLPNINTSINTLLGLPPTATKAQRQAARKGATKNIRDRVDDLSEKSTIIKDYL